MAIPPLQHSNNELHHVIKLNLRIKLSLRLCLVAISAKKVNMEPWKYQRLPQNTKQEQQCDDINSSESFIVSIPPSRSAVLDLVARIMPSTPIPDITEEYFLSEIEVHDLVSVYIPDDTVTPNGLSAWMSKDGTWGTTIRRQGGFLIHGRFTRW